MRWIVAAENYLLRTALLRTLKGLGVCAEEIAPCELRRTELHGPVMILLETGDPLRMLAIAQDVYAAWGATGKADINFFVYFRPGIPDAVAFRCWGIGPEGTVTGQTWDPQRLGNSVRESAFLIRRIIQSMAPEAPHETAQQGATDSAHTGS